MSKTALLVGGFLGGWAAFIAAAYVAFGLPAALAVLGACLFVVSFSASLVKDGEFDDGSTDTP